MLERKVLKLWKRRVDKDEKTGKKDYFSYAGSLHGAACRLSKCRGDARGGKSDRRKSDGRYMESECALPEGVTYVKMIEELEDGSLQIFDPTAGVFRTKDGSSWAKREKKPPWK